MFPSILVLVPLAWTLVTADQSGDFKITWHDDARHPRRMEKETDYFELAKGYADQFAAIVGGLDGALAVANIVQHEVEEIFGADTAEKRRQDREREDRLTRFLPLFDPLGITKSKPASAEQYEFDLGDGSGERHTAAGMILDGVGKVFDYLTSDEYRNRPSTRIFDDEL